MKSLGFTATREKVTPEQEITLTRILIQNFVYGYREFHHGCCVNGDELGAKLAKQVGYTVIAHPPTNKTLFSQHSFDISDIRQPELDYIQRNERIVEASNILLAVPGTPEEVVRSGTWATIRYARKCSKLRVIIFPDGKLKYDTS